MLRTLPKETTAIITLVCLCVAMLWTWGAFIAVADGGGPTFNSLGGLLTVVVMWPGYVTWTIAGLLVLHGAASPNTFLVVFAVAIALGGLMTYALLAVAARN